MSHALIAYGAILLYLAAATLIGLRLFRRDEPGMPGRPLTLGLGFAGLALHTWLIYDAIFSSSLREASLRGCAIPSAT